MERSSVGLSRKFRVLLVRMQLLKTIGRAKLGRNDALERTITCADGQRTGTAERKIDLHFQDNADDEPSMRGYNNYRKERVKDLQTLYKLLVEDNKENSRLFLAGKGLMLALPCPAGDVDEPLHDSASPRTSRRTQAGRDTDSD